jgi:exonuclease VII small subunit
MVAISTLIVSDISLAKSINYCQDEEVNQQWEKLADKHSEPEYKELYAFRKSLCEKIEKGALELDTAIDLFEAERTKKVERLRQRRKMLREEPEAVTG